MVTGSAQLFVVEAERMITLNLLEKAEWSMGRETGDNHPDIAFSSRTISRHHGKLVNEGGFWFYTDYSKNGTRHNGVRIVEGLNGRIKSTMLEDGDVLSLGVLAEDGVEEEAGWGLFLDGRGFDNWRKIKAREGREFVALIGAEKIEVTDPKKGQAVVFEEGAVWFMGEWVYLGGDAALMRKAG